MTKVGQRPTPAPTPEEHQRSTRAPTGFCVTCGAGASPACSAQPDPPAPESTSQAPSPAQRQPRSRASSPGEVFFLFFLSLFKKLPSVQCVTVSAVVNTVSLFVHLWSHSSGAQRPLSPLGSNSPVPLQAGAPGRAQGTWGRTLPGHPGGSERAPACRGRLSMKRWGSRRQGRCWGLAVP